MSSEGLHEPIESLSAETRDLHRAIVSLIEELEAVDWYQQRAEAAGSPELAAVLTHNKDEEVEHACMVLEWIRRQQPVFDAMLRKYLFTDRPVTEIEHAEDGAEGPPSAAGTLGIGSLKGR